MSALRSAAATALLLTSVLVSPGTARAYEDQVTVGLDAGYALAMLEEATHGVAFGADASIGLGDLFSLRGRIGYSYHPQGDGLHVVAAGAEVIYLLDVFEWVPYFGAGVDGFATVFPGDERFDLGLHAVVGVEWLGSRDWLIGLDIRPYLLPLAFDDDPFEPVHFTTTLRFSLIFDL